jgi:conjugative transfer signal peptidase TraF
MPGRFSRITFVHVVVWPPLALVIAGLAGVRVNLTASVPRGLYLITHAPRATYAEFCPPELIAPLSVERGYREAGGANACADGAHPLIKPVAAVQGDVVEVRADGVVVNGVPIANSAPRLKDSHGRTLLPWPSGRYAVPKGSVWLISRFNARSFDSRYFGPVAATDIRAFLRPLWTE